MILGVSDLLGGRVSSLDCRLPPDSAIFYFANRGSFFFGFTRRTTFVLDEVLYSRILLKIRDLRCLT